jgi:hypothetical protein
MNEAANCGSNRRISESDTVVGNSAAVMSDGMLGLRSKVTVIGDNQNSRPRYLSIVVTADRVVAS